MKTQREEKRLRQRDYNKYRKGWDRDKYNAEGYKDMTAYLALKRVEKEERRNKKTAGFLRLH